MMPQSKIDEILAAHGWQLTAEHDEIPGVVPPPNAHGFVAVAEPVSLGAVQFDPVKAVRVRSAVADRCGVVLHRLAEFPNVVLVESRDGSTLSPLTALEAVHLRPDGVLLVDQARLRGDVAIIRLPDGAAVALWGEQRVNLGALARTRFIRCLPPCPELEGWLADCHDEWLNDDVRELLESPLDPAWAQLRAAARLERFGFDESDDITAPSRVRSWARAWSSEAVDEVESEVGTRAELLIDDLRSAETAALNVEPTWPIQLLSVLRRRDDLDAVHTLLRAHRPSTALQATLQHLDEEGSDVTTALPPWEPDEEWMWRVSIGLPDAWWVQPISSRED